MGRKRKRSSYLIVNIKLKLNKSTPYKVKLLLQVKATVEDEQLAALAGHKTQAVPIKE